ncbi:MAG: ubiquinone biosynthesis protein [Alphaproteobacteria bacterium CG_4_9_14_3_um_filter_47_13]|nr:MAG: ubiquinone biosynthesis protein [Alphaproteobacteria bacterium CG_4_9_14_3_um_filter_47_13]
MKNPDVIIIGGGLAGLTLTALMAEKNVNVLCIDREKPQETLLDDFDGRTTAISYGSQKVLQEAGIWSSLEKDCCPIESIRILDGGSPVLLEFESREVGGKTFGWIAENRLIRNALYKKITSQRQAGLIAPAVVSGFSVDEKNAHVFLDDGTTYNAPLVIGADGRFSFTREWMKIGTRQWSYKQRAVICTVIHENAHNNIAVEHFRPEGPFAILPMCDDKEGKHRSSVVWTEHGTKRHSALHYTQDVFDAALEARFPSCYGAVHQIEKRFSYPLSLVHAHQYIAPRMALVAEAAHGIHPIAGQGLNMGFRDLATITELISAACKNGQDPGSEEVLKQYQQHRRFDNMAMAGATDSLNKLFSNDLMPVKLARKAGLRIVSRLPFAKKLFMNQAMGAAGLLPSMIKDRDAA